MALSHFSSLTAQLIEDNNSISVAASTYDTLMTDMVWDCAHDRAPPYETWIEKWASKLAELPNTVMIPPEAAAVTTPLHTDKWQAVLTRHPNRPLVNFFISGIT